ncbi:hypothetical protein CSKR_100646 [Clonorchis sinensis]|uniref:Uncharacterized protein n=1 Tax=Clonorchis sinensis TaxID=79923 RepID=A0A419PFW4_CLOSI|nr:hypothetical protein CSKR_100646 [Clonorchis sinensis]
MRRLGLMRFCSPFVTSKWYLRVTHNNGTSGKTKQNKFINYTSFDSRYSSKTNDPIGLQKYEPNEQTGPHVRQYHAQKVGHKWPDDLKAK